MFQSWIFLLLAISTEIAGTLTMHATGHSGNPWMYAVMYFLVSCSYITLSFALRKISVGIAIAIWEGLGTSLITLISILFLGETLSLYKALGISLAIFGIVLLHFGEKEAPAGELS